MTPHVKLVLEMPSLAELHPDFGVALGLLPGAAVRYHRRWLAIDGGVWFMADGGNMVPIPYLAASVRF